MQKFHVLAAMRTIDILPLHRTGAMRAFVTVAREQKKAHRSQRNHYQSDQGLFHATTIRSGQAFLESIVKRADIHMMALRHQVEKRAQVGVGEARETLFDLADDPALATI
jgi:hypothetical protein